MNIKLCIGDLSSMLGCRGKYKLLKAVRLQSHPLRMCPQDMAAMGEQREGPCTGLVSIAFSHCTLGGCACCQACPLQLQHWVSCHPPILFILNLGRFVSGRRCFVTSAFVVFSGVETCMDVLPDLHHTDCVLSSFTLRTKPKMARALD